MTCACAGCFSSANLGKLAKGQQPQGALLCEKCLAAGCEASREGSNALFDETACCVRRRVLKTRADSDAAKAVRKRSPA